MSIEQQVAAHYTVGRLEEAIFEALRKSGKDIDRLAASDLSAVDEFHLGWRPQTVELAKELGLRTGMHVLDIGCGIGGPARYFADAHGCKVVGVDLTEEYVRVAETLTRRCGLSDRASFRQGSALALPLDDGSFDAATLIHVGMNVENKAGLFAEARRVLGSGGRFAVYEVMRDGKAEIPYPMPWAAGPETSFVASVETYRELLEAAGFRIESERNRRDFVLELARERRDKAAKEGQPVLGLHILIGPATPERMGNVMSALEKGIVAPVELIARAD